MGDESAFPSLRQGLDSDYRSIRAQCARALATLGDASIIPLLLQRLPAETDKGLLVAYAAALGKLQAAEAIDTLFSILDSTENEGARMELALSIARITGHEQPFIWLLRQARHDPGTTASQAISHLKKRLGGFDNPELIRLGNEAASLFARDDFAAAIPLLIEMVTLLPTDLCPERGTKIITECAARLRQHGAAHREYLILALHTLDFICHHQSKAPAP
jgi:HEAT repeat protein